MDMNVRDQPCGQIERQHKPIVIALAMIWDGDITVKWRCNSEI